MASSTENSNSGSKYIQFEFVHKLKTREYIKDKSKEQPILDNNHKNIRNMPL